ncbi:hypothetical protein L810_2547 [Burkholderia sp. AU4i]|nr:hypothetical protein L810_2547 [Burkholderia sp. AU4i]MDW9241890.1 hypothetical protein [Burkholderia cepacia]
MAIARERSRGGRQVGALGVAPGRRGGCPSHAWPPPAPTMVESLLRVP